ncbi:hypothetical protein Bca101_050536 [Brassica carinata]
MDTRQKEKEKEKEAAQGYRTPKAEPRPWPVQNRSPRPLARLRHVRTYQGMIG